MSCHKIPGGYICGPDGPYKYKGYVFEVTSHLGPVPLTKKLNPRRRNVPAGFWDAVTEFAKLDCGEKRRYLI